MQDATFLFTGQTGTCKRELAEKLACRTALSHFQWDGLALSQRFGTTTPATFDDPELRKAILNHQDVRAYIQVHEIDEHFDLPEYLDSYNAAWQEQLWERTVARLYDRISAPPNHRPKYTFLLLHYFHYRNGRFFSNVNWDRLTPFRLRGVITLIDDIFDIWERIRAKQEQFNTRTVISLEDILLWRTAEIAGSKQLAHNLYVNPSLYDIQLSKEPWTSLPEDARIFFGGPVPNWVVAVKHPLETFYRMLFEPHRTMIYASYPISSVRGSKKGRAEIDAFRARLTEHFTVFDPLTIDELRTDAFEQWKAGTRTFDKFPPRWPVPTDSPIGPPAIAETAPTKNPFRRWDYESRKYYPLSDAELRSLKTAVWHRVVERDFLLESQSDHVAAYRPFYGRRPNLSGGVGAEMQFSSDLHIPIAAYHPRQDSHPAQRKLFEQIAKARVSWFPQLPVKANDTTQGLDEMIDHLKKYKRPSSL